jgi:hypothetical protein
MSKIDEVFGPLPGPLIAEWGQTALFTPAGDTGTYDPATGVVTVGATPMTVKVVISKVDPTEYGGLYQGTDWKVMIDPAQIGGRYIDVGDTFTVDGKTARVLNPVTYRGDRPVFFVCIARPQ